VYSALHTIQWLVQDYVLGGLTAQYTAEELVMGWYSNLIMNLQFTPDEDFTSEKFKRGDAIYYSPSLTPFIHKDMWSGASNNPYATVNTGYPVL